MDSSFSELVSRLTSWSIYGQAKSIEDTEKVIKGSLPTDEGDGKTYRIAYAVHMALESTDVPAEGASQAAEPTTKRSTGFVGLVTLKSLDAGSLVLPEHLGIPSAAASTTLTTELAYMFLPIGWGKGYATESVSAVLESCKKARSFWTPYSKVYIRAMVNAENPASMRVMDKTGMTKMGVFEWTGSPIFLAGKWREQDSLHIFGMHLLE